MKKKKKNYSTPYSRVVSHRSTDGAITSLTSEIGRDPVLSGVYGRSYCGTFSRVYILVIPLKFNSKRSLPSSSPFSGYRKF